MPVLQSITDIYLRAPGITDQHTLRGVIVRVVPQREREYKGGLVSTIYLKDLPARRSNITTANQRFTTSIEEVVAGSAGMSSIGISSTKNEASSSSVVGGAAADLSLHHHQQSKAIEEARVAVAKATREQEQEDFAKQRAQSEHGGTADKLTRVMLYDDWSRLSSACGVGDVFEIRKQFCVFQNPDTDGAPVFAAGRPATEHLVTTTPKSEVSIYSKEELDVMELFMSAENIKSGEPLCRVARNLNFAW